MRKNRILQLLADNRQATGRRVELVRAQGADEATLYLYDAIVSEALMEEWGYGVAAQNLVPQIRELDVGTIHLRINSPGGDVFAAQAIAQALREHRAHVVAHVDGVAASAASVIMVAADEAVIAPGGFVMIHNAWTFAMGNRNDLVEIAGMLEQVDDSIAAQYAGKAGGEKKKWADFMDAETWFAAQAAVDEGLVNAIADGAKANAAAWNLRAYSKPPADQLQARQQDLQRQAQQQAQAQASRDAHAAASRRLQLIERAAA
jgi:ATP-dependent Clp protease protease subunit